jgi:hypothetical protein
MTWSDIETRIRGLIVSDSITALTPQRIMDEFNGVYLQWWKRASDKVCLLTDVATLAVGERSCDLSDTDIVDFINVYVSIYASQLPDSQLGMHELEWMPWNDLRAMTEAAEHSTAHAAGIQSTNATGQPVYYSTLWVQSCSGHETEGYWKFMVFPICDITYYFSMNVRKAPVVLSDSSTKFEFDLEEMYGLAALTALRLMPHAGLQQDQAWEQVLVSQIPPDMQELIPAPYRRHEAQRLTEENPA